MGEGERLIEWDARAPLPHASAHRRPDSAKTCNQVRADHPSHGTSKFLPPSFFLWAVIDRLSGVVCVLHRN